jgi:hypothetical protein
MLPAFTKEISVRGINITRPDATLASFDQSYLSAITPSIGFLFNFTFGVGGTIGVYETLVILDANSNITMELTATESPDASSNLTCYQSLVPANGELVCQVQAKKSGVQTYATPGTIKIISKISSDFTYSCARDIISTANCTLKFGSTSLGLVELLLMMTSASGVQSNTSVLANISVSAIADKTSTITCPSTCTKEEAITCQIVTK